MVIHWKSNNPPLKISYNDYQAIISAIDNGASYFKHPQKCQLIAIEDISHID